MSGPVLNPYSPRGVVGRDGILERVDEMTRKDYEVIAGVFAYQLDAYASEPGSRKVIRDTAKRMSRELLAVSKFNLNGNKSFKPEVFLVACGVQGG